MNFIHSPGPLEFTIKDKDGNVYKGKCYAVSISQNMYLRKEIETSINFYGTDIRFIPKKKKKLSKRKCK